MPRKLLRLVRDELPDLAFLDVTMPGGGIEGRTQELASVLPSVSAGEVHVAPSLAFGLLRAMSRPRPSDPLAELSSRERHVLELIANGLSNQEIGLTLGLGEKTIMTNILTKLRVRSRVEAALLAARLGLGQSHPGLHG